MIQHVLNQKNRLGIQHVFLNQKNRLGIQHVLNQKNLLVIQHVLNQKNRLGIQHVLNQKNLLVIQHVLNQKNRLRIQHVLNQKNLLVIQHVLNQKNRLGIQHVLNQKNLLVIHLFYLFSSQFLWLLKSSEPKSLVFKNCWESAMIWLLIMYNRYILSVKLRKKSMFVIYFRFINFHEIVSIFGFGWNPTIGFQNILVAKTGQVLDFTIYHNQTFIYLSPLFPYFPFNHPFFLFLSIQFIFFYYNKITIVPQNWLLAKQEEYFC